MKTEIKLCSNQAAFSSGIVRRMMADNGNTGNTTAFPAYRAAVIAGAFDPSVSASVCFVAGFLGNEYPSHDDRVTA